MSTGASQSIPVFVDREDEIKRIDEFIEKALRSEGHLLTVRGESGVGKTRLIQEAVEQARSRGFSVGFGAGLSESVIPYQPWTDALRHVGLENILEETPPPKLLALYLLDSEGSVMTKVKLKDIGASTLKTAEAVLKRSHGNPDNSGESVVKEGNLIIRALESQRLLVLQDKKVGLGALIGGLEDEIFLDDLQELVNSVGSCFDKPLSSKKSDGDSIAPAKVLMRNLLDMGKYGGIDYAQDNPELRRMRLHNNAALGLARKAAINPILLVLDDIQWVDPSSLALLQYVTRNTRQSAVLILSAYRTEEGVVRPHLNSVLKKIDQEELSTELDLMGLAREHLSALANSFLGHHELPEDFIDHLWTETEGNPLFVREVLHRLEDEGAIQLKASTKRLVHPMETLAIPARVREIIRARLELLSKEDRALLDTAAVCGSRFTASLVAKVAGEEESTVLNGLNNIARLHGLLQPAGYDFAFNHSTVQEVVHEALPEETSRTYHRKVAQWLELAGAPIEDIAEHYYFARDKRALTMLYKAASTAQAKYANEEAIRFYNQALEFEEDIKKRMEIFEAMGDVYGLTGEYDYCVESYEKALEYAKEDRTKAGIMAKIGNIHLRRGENDDSIRVSTEAYDLVRGKECKEEASSLNNIGNLYQSRGEYDKAFDNFGKSLEIREKIGDQEGIAGSLNNIGLVHKDQGDYNRALEYFNRSVVISERIDHQQFLVRHLHNIGVVQSLMGEYNKALEYFGKSLNISEKIGDQEGIVLSLTSIGYGHYERGEYAKALEYLGKGLEISEKIGSQHVFSCLHNVGMVHSCRGEYGKALEYLRKSLELEEMIGDSYGKSTSCSCIAEVHLKTGDLKKALDFCNRAFNLSRDIGYRYIIARSRRIFGMIFSEQSKWKESIENFEQCIEILKKIKLEWELGISHYEFGLMWKTKGDLVNAKEHLNKALDIFKKLKLEKKIEKVKAALESLDVESSRPSQNK